MGVHEETLPYNAWDSRKMFHRLYGRCTNTAPRLKQFRLTNENAPFADNCEIFPLSHNSPIGLPVMDYRNDFYLSTEKPIFAAEGIGIPASTCFLASANLRAKSSYHLTRAAN